MQADRVARVLAVLLTLTRVRRRAAVDGVSVAQYLLTAVNTALDADDYCENYLAFMKREMSDAN